jgi:phage-related protein (TIGR01555 family)
MNWKFWERSKPEADRLDGYTPPDAPEGDPWKTPEILQQLEVRAQGNRFDSYHLDSFKNELTGIGDWNRDKTFGGTQGGPQFVVTFLSGNACMDRWRGSDLGGRVIETIPDEMTREGWDITIQPGDDGDDAEAAAEEEKLNADWRADCARDPKLGVSGWLHEEKRWRAQGRTDVADACRKLSQRWREYAHRIDEFPPGGAAGDAPPGLAPFMAPPRPTPMPEIDDETPQIIEEIEGKLEELGAADAFWQALCYERAYGGGAILLGADDGMDPSMPLDETRINDVKFLNVFRGGWDGEVVAWSYYRDINDKKYGQPEMYMVRNMGVPIARIPAPGSAIQVQPDPLPKGNGNLGYGSLVTWVHESRLLVFGGTPVSHQAAVQMRGWGDSVFTRIDRVLQQFDQTWGGVSILMQDFSQGVLKIKGLLDMMSSNNKTSNGTQTLTNRARGLQMARSISRILLIDGEEEFSRDTVSLAGIADVLQQFCLRLAAASDMPVDLLMGQAAAGGLNKGDTTYRFFIDRIAARQKKRLLPQLRRLIKLVMLSKEGPCEGIEPERWSVSFKSLYQMTEIETATLRKTVAETDAINITSGKLTPEECAASEFGGSEWSMERTIDFKGREAMAAQDAKDQEARAQQMLEAAKNAPALPAGGEPKKDPPAGGAPPSGGASGGKNPFDSLDEGWVEENHSRAENGEFGEGGGSVASTLKTSGASAAISVAGGEPNKVHGLVQDWADHGGTEGAIKLASAWASMRGEKITDAQAAHMAENHTQFKAEYESETVSHEDATATVKKAVDAGRSADAVRQARAIAAVSQAAYGDAKSVDLFRGISGAQAQTVRDAIARGEKTVKIAVDPASSFTSSRSQAAGFAKGQGGQGKTSSKGIVVKYTAPVRAILLSHKAFEQLSGENEVVVATRGYVEVSASQISMRDESDGLELPLVQQQTDYSCGAAALLCVLRYRGRMVTDEQALYAHLGTTPEDGTTPEGIEMAGRLWLGGDVRCVYGASVEDLRAALAAGNPVILDVQEPDGEVLPGGPDGHYVVLSAMDANAAEVMNPSTGKMESIALTDLLDRWIDVEGRRCAVFFKGARSDAGWNEEDHPRAENGEFGAGGGGAAKSSSSSSSESSSGGGASISKSSSSKPKAVGNAHPQSAGEGKESSSSAPSSPSAPASSAAKATAAKAAVGKVKPAAIPKVEKWVDHIEGEPKETWEKTMTGNPDPERNPNAASAKPTPERQPLHDKIAADYLDKVQPVPAGEEKVAVLTMGGPASGKTSLVKSMGIDESRFVSVDPDGIKERFPEYQKATGGAWKEGDGPRTAAKDAAFMAHEESSFLAKRIRDTAIEQGKNVVIDGTGANADKFVDMMGQLKEKGYKVKVIYPDLDAEAGIPRMMARAEKTGRVVPEAFARKAYAKIAPNFQKIAAAADSFTMFDARPDMAQGGTKLVWSRDSSGKETVHDPGFVAEFKKRNFK